MRCKTLCKHAAAAGMIVTVPTIPTFIPTFIPTIPTIQTHLSVRGNLTFSPYELHTFLTNTRWIQVQEPGGVQVKGWSLRADGAQEYLVAKLQPDGERYTNL